MKYRVFSLHEKRYLNNEDLIFINMKGELYQGDYRDFTGKVYKLDNKNYVIEKCTHLEDKTGRDIYEGDILLWCENNDESKNQLSEVVYKFGGFWVCGINWLSNWELFEYNESYKIIGNIHENKELLED